MVRAALRWGAIPLLATLLSAGPAVARPLRSHGQLLQLAAGPHGTVQTSKSNNWFGFNQGALAGHTTLYHSITADWTVPRARQHANAQAESSSDWIGIGGGCVDTGCAVTDPTLIQTGTEQDVASNGATSYSAWWEVIPGPSFPIKMRIRPGDRIHASITELVPASNLWAITIHDLTRRESHTLRVPYTSTQDSAEWIEETPLILGANAGFAALPELTSPRFDRATVNGHPANFTTSQAIDLIDSSSKVIAVPSAPDRDRDGFNACTWAGACPPPPGS
jgi:Peptidase A4 family